MEKPEKDKEEELEEFATFQQNEIKMIDIKEIREDKTVMLAELFVHMIPLGWMEVLHMYRDEIATVGEILQKKVSEGQILCPHPWNIYRAFQLTPWWRTKVVIIGQDPYYSMNGSEPAATGCCFETWNGEMQQFSLGVILRQLWSKDNRCKKPQNGELTKWAAQGVLLMNAALTTCAGVAGAHQEIWAFFPKRILQFLSKRVKNVVYMLWGKEAQSYKKFIEKGNLILECPHPAARGRITFSSMDHFNEANEYLKKNNLLPIDWRL